MPLQKLQFRPGVNREGTTLANEGGWFDGDKIRFRSGYPEKIGGWAAISYNTFLGVCRSLWNWITLKGFNLVGVGTNSKMYIENGGAYYDITPLRATSGAGTTTFAAVNGLSTITVTDSAATNVQVGDYVTFTGAVSLGGNITAAVLNQEYVVETTLSGTSYTISARAAVSGNVAANNGGAPVLANSSDVGNGGGSVVAAYQINAGPAYNTVGTGWGTSPFGGFIPGTASTTLSSTINNSVTTIPVTSTASLTAAGGVLIDSEYITYTGKTTGPDTLTGAVRGASGTTATSHSSGALVTQATTFTGWGSPYSASTIPVALRVWSQANFGEILLFNPRGGALYSWAPGSGTSPAFNTRATEVTGLYVPTVINEIMVSDASRITIAFGCNPYDDSALDPLLVRWSDRETYTDWDPTDTTKLSGFQRLSHGSTIVGALQTRQEILIWTDASLYSMQFVGLPYVWRFDILADNISIVSQNGMASAAGVTYWMGVDKFYVYSGRVETLPCSVRTYVYEDINISQANQFFASTNEGYSEIWWFYCSANSDVIDRYVIFNYLDRVWYYGTMNRTAWLDSPLLPYPIAATQTNLLVYHEASVNDGSTNPPSPISAYVQSSDFDIGDGHNYGFVWQIIPDITFDGSDTSGTTSVYPTAQFTVRPRRNPGANYGTSDTPNVASTQSYAGQSTYNVQQFTQTVNARLRGRQMAFKVSSDTLGTQWQLGTPRINIRPDGRK